MERKETLLISFMIKNRHMLPKIIFFAVLDNLTHYSFHCIFTYNQLVKIFSALEIPGII